MAKVSVTPLVFDPYGPVAVASLDERASDLREIGRRATRTATLDGGAAVYDAGYAVADRTVIVRLRADAPAAEVEGLRRMVKTHARVVLGLPDGIFLACPSAASFTNGKPSFTYLLIAAETEF